MAGAGDVGEPVTCSGCLKTAGVGDKNTFFKLPVFTLLSFVLQVLCTGGTDKSLARPGRKQATATENFEFHTSYL